MAAPDHRTVRAAVKPRRRIGTQAMAATDDARLNHQGYKPLSGMPAACAAYIESEIVQWTKIVKASGRTGRLIPSPA
jgi:hypothetical protein